jgi:hypothetical protein
MLAGCFCVVLTFLLVKPCHSEEPEAAHWWAIQPLTNPLPPHDPQNDWSHHPVDAFILEGLKELGLKPAPEADRLEWIRRAFFDLTGLPPSSEAIDAFMEDTRPEARRHLIDRLLESPHYGERWGQHWLDLTRWAESDGYRQDAFRPHAWPYRDYVIRSFNDDKPYDRFIQEQLAGDELEPDNPDVVIGTAFLRNGIYEYNQRNVQMHWELIVDELTALTGEALMGVGIACAQCHDHKFDPIPQEDYYRLKAMLAPVHWRFDEFLATPEERRTYEEQLARWKEQTQGIQNQIDTIVEPRIKAKQDHALGMFPDAIQEIFKMSPEDRSPYQAQLMALADIQIRYERERFDATKEIKGEDANRLAKLRNDLAAFDHLKPEPLMPAFVASDIGQQAPEVRLEGQLIAPGVLTALQSLPIQDVAAQHKGTTGRRLALAKWLTHPSHPLTPRVLANRIWQKHFDVGLVASPNDFGKLGQHPSHPALLDWLSSELLRSGWSIKHMHRLIMTSATYAQSCRREPNSAISQVDPQNRMLWKYPPKRLDAAQIRDAMLMASGELDPALGGPSVKGNHPRRSVYVRKIRNSPDEWLKGFDAPVGFNSTPVRDSTTTTTQALLMINGSWGMERARHMSDDLRSKHPEEPGQWVHEAYLRCYGRRATRDEWQRGLAFLDAAGSGSTGLVDFCHVMLCSNEFMYLH